MFSSVFIALTLAASAFANVYVTQPVESTIFAAGQPATLSWQDNGSSPSLHDFGLSKISIYAGNAKEQTFMQAISTSTDVEKTTSIVFTPDPTIGPNADEYFIRFESLNLKDTTQPQYPALAFSAKFSLSGMTGQFSKAVQAEIDGQSTAPIAAPTAGPSGSVSSLATPTLSAGSASIPSTTPPAKIMAANAGSKPELAGLACVFGVASLLIGSFI
ncbi:hypothetical protein SERLA73DRAFT_87877 [Serpula lacrymans var. lacrymans S7.3]|uniref:Yeast cell wall synthesis Kre9/Knh1-like N-terminal domain-containing protein n=2 Tax=Serpula lacrymans var. lacrymans TaxID=341189 RepID=F8PSI5_SERL3|nr:uncharacterized protein SERLADRAFT_436771 [Serpula lacrymans var. lacrymans S7.9]EGO01315.1 hypothetical protein SERLA73DRAFT_87877 [Serpula lacrymans var. lacrymans S7.3]EGO26954.1 hypothetical protein SERLADRAFT_436771 [Serpula lacrymans var. lacrymans S7.9]